jgi:hypothetical protein
MKKVLKFKHDGKEGFLSIVEKNSRYYSLVQKNTSKVDEIIQTNKLSISYELKNPIYQDINVEVLFDQDLIQWVYQKLEEEKNLYFKQLDDSLCVLEIPINNHQE